MPDLPDKRLEVAAWSYLLSNLLKAPSRHQVLASFAQVLESMPKAFRSELLGRHGSKSPAASVRRLSGETRSAIRHQLKYCPSAELDSKSILDEILDT